MSEIGGEGRNSGGKPNHQAGFFFIILAQKRALIHILSIETIETPPVSAVLDQAILINCQRTPVARSEFWLTMDKCLVNLIFQIKNIMYHIIFQVDGDPRLLRQQSSKALRKTNLIILGLQSRHGCNT